LSEVIVDQNSSHVRAITEDGQEHDVGVRMTSSIIEDLIDHGVIIRYDNPAKAIQQVMSILEMTLVTLFTVYVMYIIFSRSAGSNYPQNMLNSMMQTRAKEIDGEKITTTFDDIAGIDYAKKELQEVVDFLKNPEKYTRVGAKIPKGVLLAAGSGLGKTLLAKAVAGTAGVPFFSASASEFVEMFVGVGSGRIRSLFAKAKAKAPCIVFIDEIDAVGKARSGNLMGPGNDEREQTINQLLTEMDGFEGNTGVVVIGATNRVDILDKALLRPGRFDRIVTIDAPDVVGRTEILKVHTRGKPLAPAVNLESIARITAGFSGAELQNLANEAAINAARHDRNLINQHDFEEALEKVMMGPLKTARVISDAKKQIVAVHEAGHTIAAFYVGDYDEVRKVSIIPRGGAGGVTMFEPDADRVDSGLYTRTYLENKLVVALGGRAAEEIVFGPNAITTGASHDMEQVYKVARVMVTRYGFSDVLGTIGWDTDGGSFSQDTARTIDQEMNAIVSRAYRRAKNIIEDRLEYLKRLSNALIEKEVLDAAQIKEILTEA
jgi:cell division protease FtsH